MTDENTGGERLQRIARRWPAVTFTFLAYLLSWGVWGGGYLLVPADLPFVPVVFLGVFGPAVAGAVTVRATGGSIRDWLRTSLTWRIAPQWYLAAIFIPVLIYGIGAGGLLLAGASARPGNLGLGVAVFLGGLPTATLLSGGNEELGWRGVLLPQLQQRHDALSASVVVGSVWAGWHLPVYVLPLGLTDGPFLLFVPFAVLFSVVYTWVYNSTDGSVLVAMVMHGSMNSAVGIFAGILSTDAVSTTILWGTRPVGVFCVVVVLVVVYGRETLAARSVRTSIDSVRTEPLEGVDE